MKRKRRVGSQALSRVRHNINLLDRPMFVASPRKAKLSVYTDNNGFTMTASDRYGLPTIFDKKLLYMLMYETQRQGSNVLRFNSMHELMHQFDLGTNVREYRRVDRSLKRLASMRLEFTDDSFYETSSKSKSLRSLAILGDLSLSRESICISIEQSFIDLHSMQFVRSLPLEAIKQFNNPIALRLFELTSKIIGSDSWLIGIDKLQGKLTIEYKNKRDLTRSLDAALKELHQIKSYENFTYEIDNTNVVTFKKRG